METIVPVWQRAGPGPLPGLRLRGLVLPDDLEPIAAVIRAGAIADGIDEIMTPAQLENEFAHTSTYEPLRDVLVAELDGRVVATATASHRVLADGHMYTTFGHVDPSVRRRGIGRHLLATLQAHGRALAASIGETGCFETFTDDREQATIALLRSNAYRPVRWFFEMERSPLHDLPEAPLPDGIELREVVPATLRRIFDADSEAFRDHWGYREWGDAEFEALAANPDLDTTLWAVAWDGDEVAGVVETFVFAEENELLGLSRAWLEHVSVRRPWRGRGIARALIVESMRRIRARGYAAALLGVDAENPTGAVRLYEGVGFRVIGRGQAWRRPIDGAADAGRGEGRDG